VVIAIIALLVSILLPSLSRARDIAKTVYCASSMRNIGMASLIYANDHDGASPSATYTVNYSNASLSYAQKMELRYAASLFGNDYIGSGEPSAGTLRQWACPVYLADRGLGWYVNADGSLHDAWPSFFAYNYGMGHSNHDPDDSDNQELEHLDEVVFNIYNVTEASGFMLLAETHTLGAHEQRSLYINVNWLADYGRRVAYHNSWSYWASGVGPEPHLGKMNAVMYDGHVETMPYGQLRDEEYYICSD
jgi:prepilin-type processing-associated H-X9-DG protein